MQLIDPTLHAGAPNTTVLEGATPPVGSTIPPSDARISTAELLPTDSPLIRQSQAALEFNSR